MDSEKVSIGEGGAGVTSISRHWGAVPVREGLTEAVWEAGGGGRGSVCEGATDWKACMGSASKNSWAMMNGVLEGSLQCSLVIDCNRAISSGAWVLSDRVEQNECRRARILADWSICMYFGIHRWFLA